MNKTGFLLLGGSLMLVLESHAGLKLLNTNVLFFLLLENEMMFSYCCGKENTILPELPVVGSGSIVQQQTCHQYLKVF